MRIKKTPLLLSLSATLLFSTPILTHAAKSNSNSHKTSLVKHKQHLQKCSPKIQKKAPKFNYSKVNSKKAFHRQKIKTTPNSDSTDLSNKVKVEGTFQTSEQNKDQNSGDPKADILTGKKDSSVLAPKDQTKTDPINSLPNSVKVEDQKVSEKSDSVQNLVTSKQSSKTLKIQPATAKLHSDSTNASPWTLPEFKAVVVDGSKIPKSDQELQALLKPVKDQINDLETLIGQVNQPFAILTSLEQQIKGYSSEDKKKVEDNVKNYQDQLDAIQKLPGTSAKKTIVNNLNKQIALGKQFIEDAEKVTYEVDKAGGEKMLNASIDIYTKQLDNLNNVLKTDQTTVKSLEQKFNESFAPKKVDPIETIKTDKQETISAVKVDVNKTSKHRDEVNNLVKIIEDQIADLKNKNIQLNNDLQDLKDLLQSAKNYTPSLQSMYLSNLKNYQEKLANDKKLPEDADEQKDYKQMLIDNDQSSIGYQQKALDEYEKLQQSLRTVGGYRKLKQKIAELETTINNANSVVETDRENESKIKSNFDNYLKSLDQQREDRIKGFQQQISDLEAQELTINNKLLNFTDLASSFSGFDYDIESSYTRWISLDLENLAKAEHLPTLTRGDRDKRQAEIDRINSSLASNRKYLNTHQDIKKKAEDQGGYNNLQKKISYLRETKQDVSAQIDQLNNQIKNLQNDFT